MADSNSRTIKIDFKVNTQSLADAKVAIGELTKQLEALGQASAKIGGSGGININSGGGTQIVRTQNTNVRGGGKGGGFGALKISPDIIQSFKDLSKEAKSSFDSISSNLKQFVQASTPQFTALNNQLMALKGNLQAIKATGNMFDMRTVNNVAGNQSNQQNTNNYNGVEGNKKRGLVQAIFGRRRGAAVVVVREEVRCH